MPKEVFHFRLSAVGLALLDRVKRKLHLRSRAAVIEQAIRAYAAEQGVTVASIVVPEAEMEEP